MYSSLRNTNKCYYFARVLIQKTTVNSTKKVKTMKRSFRALGVLALASGLVLSSCTKDIETSDFTLDQSKQGTVKAYVYAEFNKQTNGKEYAPDGTMVILSIDASQLNGNIAAGKAKWTDTVTVKNGMIEKKVPTTNKGIVTGKQIGRAHV